MTLARSLREQAANRPDEPVLVYLAQGEADRVETFRELHEEARQVAGWLLRAGLDRGDRALIAL